MAELGLGSHLEHPPSLENLSGLPLLNFLQTHRSVVHNEVNTNKLDGRDTHQLPASG